MPTLTNGCFPVNLIKCVECIVLRKRNQIFFIFPVNKKWELLKPAGDPPPSLQEHTAVTFRDNIFVFGGELGFSGGIETPLWIYESKVS